MAIERFIRGKVDSARHFGKRAEVRAKASSQARLDEYYLSERDPVGMDFVSGDIYVEGLHRELEELRAQKRYCEG